MPSSRATRTIQIRCVDPTNHDRWFAWQVLCHHLGIESDKAFALIDAAVADPLKLHVVDKCVPECSHFDRKDAKKNLLRWGFEVHFRKTPLGQPVPAWARDYV